MRRTRRGMSGAGPPYASANSSTTNNGSSTTILRSGVRRATEKGMPWSSLPETKTRRVSSTSVAG